MTQRSRRFHAPANRLRLLLESWVTKVLQCHAVTNQTSTKNQKYQTNPVFAPGDFSLPNSQRDCFTKCMANAPIEYASAGGQGVIEPAPSRSDLRLYRKAINGGYNLTPEQRANIVAVAAGVLNAGPCITESGISYRDALAAAKVLLACDKMDLEVEKLAQGPGGVTNNTQVNIDARGNAALESLTIDELLAIRDKMRAGSNGKH